MPAQANATVTAVTGQGTGDDWDRPATPGAAKWSGAARAYLRERIDRVPSGDSVNVFTRRALILDTADYDSMGLDTDDVVTFTPDGGSSQSSPAKAIAPARLAGMPRDVQTTRVELEAA